MPFLFPRVIRINVVLIMHKLTCTNADALRIRYVAYTYAYVFMQSFYAYVQYVRMLRSVQLGCDNSSFSTIALSINL